MDASDRSPPSVPPMAPPEGVGAFLRARREALGLSYVDVASVVKLPPKRIESLEAERWSDLPDGPFLRGFLRNVARALDIDEASLMARVDDSLMRERNPESILVPASATRATLPRRSGPMEDRHGGRMLVFGAFLFALVAALIAWSGTESFDRMIASGKGLVHSSTPETVAKTEPAPAPAVDTATAANPAEALPATGTDAASAPGATPVPAATTAAAVPSSPLALLFHFNEDCWIEVRDAEGKVLLKALNAAGSERSVEGQAPYTLVVGNAKGVDLHFRGRSVDLVPYTRDQVARLTLS